MKYVSFDPEAQVIGQAMLGFKAAIGKEIIEPLLKKYGLTDIQPEQWYSLQEWLNVLSDIEFNAGDSSMLTFVDIGMGVAANVIPPAQIEQFKREGFVDAVVNIGGSNYRRDHRGNVGKLDIKKINDQQVTSFITSPYPPDFWYGNMYGIAKRFCSSFIVQYENLSMRYSKPGEPVIIHTILKK